MFSTVSSEFCSSEISKWSKEKHMQKLMRYKGKIIILSKSANKTFKNSHLLWMKYFLLIILKSDI